MSKLFQHCSCNPKNTSNWHYNLFSIPSNALGNKKIHMKIKYEKAFESPVTISKFASISNISAPPLVPLS